MTPQTDGGAHSQTRCAFTTYSHYGTKPCAWDMGIGFATRTAAHDAFLIFKQRIALTKPARSQTPSTYFSDLELGYSTR